MDEGVELTPETAPAPKTRISLEIEDLETGDSVKTRVEFYDDSPEAMRVRVAHAAVKIISKMGYLEEKTDG